MEIVITKYKKAEARLLSNYKKKDKDELYNQAKTKTQILEEVRKESTKNT
jgi:hypothetical protein